VKQRLSHWLVLLGLGVSACVNDGSFSRQFTSQQAALPLMEYIVLNANQCWFKSGTHDFRPYRLAPELTSFSGRPRLLLVPYNEPTARPLLVIEAQGDPAQLNVYGSLMTTKTGKRISHDLGRWLEAKKHPEKTPQC